MKNKVISLILMVVVLFSITPYINAEEGDMSPEMKEFNKQKFKKYIKKARNAANGWEISDANDYLVEAKKYIVTQEDEKKVEQTKKYIKNKKKDIIRNTKNSVDVLCSLNLRNSSNSENTFTTLGIMNTTYPWIGMYEWYQDDSIENPSSTYGDGSKLSLYADLSSFKNSYVALGVGRGEKIKNFAGGLLGFNIMRSVDAVGDGIMVKAFYRYERSLTKDDFDNHSIFISIGFFEGSRNLINMGW